MRPVFHWAAHRIHAHVAITVLALLLERVIKHTCQDTRRYPRSATVVITRGDGGVIGELA